MGLHTLSSILAWHIQLWATEPRVLGRTGKPKARGMPMVAIRDFGPQDKDAHDGVLHKRAHPVTQVHTMNSDRHGRHSRRTADVITFHQPKTRGRLAAAV